MIELWMNQARHLSPGQSLLLMAVCLVIVVLPFVDWNRKDGADV